MWQYAHWYNRDRLSYRALTASRKFIRAIAPSVAWAFASLLLGTLIGLMAVILPPMAVFGFVAIVAIVLIWAIPEAPIISLRTCRILLFVMIITDLSIPAYYAISLPALPWISLRRIAILLFLLSFLVILGSSSAARREVVETIKYNKLTAYFIVGYAGMCFLSIFTSVNPAVSITSFVDNILLWYIPLIGAFLFIRRYSDAIYLLRVVCFCCLFVTFGGIASFIFHKNVFIQILPSWVINAMVENTPVFERMLTGAVADRNGFYRAESIFSVSLSFAEFEAIMLCIGYFFSFKLHPMRDRVIGGITVFMALVGIFVSGSRGGYMSGIFGTVVFSGVVIARMLRFGSRSLAPWMVMILAGLGFAALFGAVFTVPAVHNRVLGGGADAYSNQARIEQWELGIPKIESNPITGHGLGMGGAVVGYHAFTSRPTIDSYVLSVLVETGVPGLIFIFGAIMSAIYTGVNLAWRSSGVEGALGCALAGALSAFLFYRIGLAQVENFTLVFLIIAILMNARRQALSGTDLGESTV